MKVFKQVNPTKTERDRLDKLKSQVVSNSQIVVPPTSLREPPKINMRQSLPQLIQDNISDQRSPISNQQYPYSLDASPTEIITKVNNRDKRQSDNLQMNTKKRTSNLLSNKSSYANQINLISNNQSEYFSGRRNSNSQQNLGSHDSIENKIKLQQNFMDQQNAYSKQSALTNNAFHQKSQSNGYPNNKLNHFQGSKSPQQSLNIAATNVNIGEELFDLNKNPSMLRSELSHNMNQSPHYLNVNSTNSQKASLQNIDIQQPSGELRTLVSQDNLLSTGSNFYKTTNKFGKSRILSLRLKVDSPSMSHLQTPQTLTAKPQTITSQISPFNHPFKKLNFLSPNAKTSKGFYKQQFFNRRVTDSIENQKSPSDNRSPYGENFITAINNYKFFPDKDPIKENGNQDTHKRKNSDNANKNDDELYIKDMMKNSKGFHSKEDECLPGSKDIEDQFRFIHKHIDKIEEKNQFYGQQSTFLVDLVSTMNKISLPPRKMNYLKENQNCSVLNINNFQMSARQTGFFTKVINTEPYKNNLTTITANNNNITDTELIQMLDQLPPKIETLILKQNHISNLGISQISLKLQSNDCHLIQLDLENNKIKDLGAKSLFKAIQNNNTLTKLNLSQNLIGDFCSQELRELIENSFTLQELYLKWNNFRCEGGIAIANGLKKNQSLRVLDISFNNLGSIQLKKTVSSKQDQEGLNSVGKQFYEAFVSNKKLIHLDMSNCNLLDKDCLLINEGLKKNKIIYGFHFEGNSNFFVDENGYLVRDEAIAPEDVELNDIQQNGRPSAFTHSINGVQHTVNIQKKKYKDNCWVCEGWEYLEFNYDDNNNTHMKVKDELFIHFDFDGYKPHRMQKIGVESYQFHKMCPPNKTVQYFITEPAQQQIILDELSNKIQLKKAIPIKISYHKIGEQDPNDGEVVNIEVNQFNVIQTLQQNIFSQEYYLQVESGIRENE